MSGDGAFESQFHAWLERVSGGQKPPSTVVAWNIGLLETEEGYAAYLIGAVEFWFDDGDWASEEAFTPVERYFHLPPPLRDAEWEVVLETVSAAARTFLSSSLGKQSFLSRAEGIMVSFDDGDPVWVLQRYR